MVPLLLEWLSLVGVVALVCAILGILARGASVRRAAREPELGAALAPQFRATAAGGATGGATVGATAGLGEPRKAPTPAATSSPESAPSRPAPVDEHHERGQPAGPAILVARDSTRHAIVFAHGWLGTDRVGLPGLRRDYFRGVREHLRDRGFDVHLLRVSPAAGVEMRAMQLGRQIERLGGRVNVIAHSMGGLDARFAISRLGLDQHVVSLTTIGTPHLGTPIADAMVAWLGPWARFRAMLSTAGYNIDGLYDLTTQRMGAFNESVPDAPNVAYESYVGNVVAHDSVHALLLPGFHFLHRAVGENDGLVPAHSQRWGSVRGELDADHWAQVGWSGTFNTVAFYDALATHLAHQGL